MYSLRDKVLTSYICYVFFSIFDWQIVDFRQTMNLTRVINAFINEWPFLPIMLYEYFPQTLIRIYEAII